MRSTLFLSLLTNVNFVTIITQYSQVSTSRRAEWPRRGRQTLITQQLTSISRSDAFGVFFSRCQNDESISRGRYYKPGSYHCICVLPATFARSLPYVSASIVLTATIAASK